MSVNRLLDGTCQPQNLDLIRCHQGQSGRPRLLAIQTASRGVDVNGTNPLAHAARLVNMPEHMQARAAACDRHPQVFTADALAGPGQVADSEGWTMSDQHI